MAASPASRRQFLTRFTSLGLGSTLLPGIVWARLEDSGSTEVTLAMLKSAAGIAGLSLSDAELEGILKTVNQNRTRYEELRQVQIPDDVGPPFYFSAVTPGMVINRDPPVFKPSKAPSLKRPAQLEDLAFAPIVHLAALLKSRKISSVELTEMFLARLHRLNGKLNCVVTFLDDHALAEAKRADQEIAAGRYRGLLHGIPWGAKDIIALKGYKTTWGSGAYQDQVIDRDATVVEQLRAAGAVLIAKLTTGELAGGDQWFGGRTNNPWKLDQGSSGSSAGPASATVAGAVPFAIGSETSGSIFSPSSRCGATGLRPTFGRTSRYGVMALSWTQDRLGPICRSAEDCAIVMQTISVPDGRDLSMSDLGFRWDARQDFRKLRIGYFPEAFEDPERMPDWVANEKRSLEEFKKLGVSLIPLRLPDFSHDVSSISVESGVFFDSLLRSGRLSLLTNKNRGNGIRSSRFVPAVEYLQTQRARSLMMQALATATESVDVYLAPSTNGRIVPPAPEGTPPPPSRGPAQRQFQMANLAGYPGVAVPNGFGENGAPTSILFMARPFGDTEALLAAKGFQDATDYHLKHPPL